MTKRTSFPKNQIKVLLLENIHPFALEAFENEGFQVEALSVALEPKELNEKIKDVHLLGVRSKTLVTEESLSHANRLVSVGCFCIGTNQVDLSAARRRGFPVFNAPFGNTRSVAEMTVAQVVVLARQLAQRSSELHLGKWNKVSKACYEVRGKTLGIIGYGHIGSQVSALAEAFGMRVLFYDIVSKLAFGNAKSCNSLAELLSQSDCVTLHVPETPQTHHMISGPEFAQMKNGSYLINASRGHVVDHEALVEFLKNSWLGGAAIDVFPQEPVSNQGEFVSQLQGLSNVILTPHIGGATEEAQANIGTEVPAALIRFMNLGSTVGAVNFPEVELAPNGESHRILNVHKNVPGVLSRITHIVSDLGANIEAQTLATSAEIGYLVLDTDRALSLEVKQAIEALDSSIKTRMLY